MKHKHHNLIVQWAKDTTQVVEYKSTHDGEWRNAELCEWEEHVEYRIRHKHQDLIDQKAARPELIVQVKSGDEWVSLKRPCCWNPYYDYRLVEPKKKVKMWQWVMKNNRDEYFTTIRFFKSTEDINESSYEKAIKPALWTEIEVEE